MPFGCRTTMHIIIGNSTVSTYHVTQQYCMRSKKSVCENLNSMHWMSLIDLDNHHYKYLCFNNSCMKNPYCIERSKSVECDRSCRCMFSPDVKGQRTCIIAQINDKSMKIGIQDNYGTLTSKQSGPTLDFAQEGINLQSKMADIENVYFSYNL